MTSSLNEFIGHYQQRIERCLENVLKDVDSVDTRLVQAMAYSLLGGGKRIRPLLAYAAASGGVDCAAAAVVGLNSASAKGGTHGAAAKAGVNKVTDDFACALECIHVYSLIHDDLPAMDDDALRRGKPTNHLAFDEATAILAGDALQCLAFQLIAESPNASDVQKVRAVSVLAQASGMGGMVMGQAIDLHLVAASPTLAQLEAMHQRKTGALIEASVILGAISVNAEEHEITHLRHFAKAIGLAFQVQDDILDVTADTQTMGKTQGADRQRDKPTYVSLLGLEGARAKAQELREQAIVSLQHVGARADILTSLAQYIVDRRH